MSLDTRAADRREKILWMNLARKSHLFEIIFLEVWHWKKKKILWIEHVNEPPCSASEHLLLLLEYNNWPRDLTMLLKHKFMNNPLVLWWLSERGMIFSPGLFLCISHVFIKLAGTTYVQGKPEVSLLCSQVTGAHLLPRFHSLQYISPPFPSTFPWGGGSGVAEQRWHQFCFPEPCGSVPTFPSSVWDGCSSPVAPLKHHNAAPHCQHTY